MKFDHIGIVVSDLPTGRRLLRDAFQIAEWSAEFHDERIGVDVQFGRDSSGICYELVAPLGEASPVARALRDGVNILNHVAYRVADITAEAVRLTRSGFIAVGRPTPAVAFADAPIQFFISESRLLFELIEAPDHRHAYAAIPWEMIPK